VGVEVGVGLGEADGSPPVPPTGEVDRGRKATPATTTATTAAAPRAILSVLFIL
jgi:hypothetical protein